jgi:nucleoside-diphosphate-sugar epimerase
VGAPLLARYLRRGSSRVYVLVRAPSIDEARRRGRLALHDVPEPFDPTQVEFLAGDLCRPHLGLSPIVASQVQTEVAEIVHCAADTRFKAALEDARAVNVEGTRRVLAFARGCPGLERMACFSTVHVAGMHTGTIRERFLTSEAGFVNNYECSKFEMEKLVEAHVQHLPIAIYRLSTIVGNAADGRVTVFGAVHHALRLLYQGLVPMVPGRSGTLVDLVPLDFAVETVDRLLQQRFESGTVYHVCAGLRSASTLDELLTAALRALEEYRPAWRRRRIERPSIVDGETFDLLERSVEASGNAILSNAVRSVGSFARQLLYPKVYDDANTRRALGGVLDTPRVLDYFPRVVRYCLQSEWGTKGHGTTSV